MGQTAPRRRSLPAEPGSGAPGRFFRFARAREEPAAAELRAGLRDVARGAAQQSQWRGSSPGWKNSRV